ncbi:MAG: type II toxin-antitoxin system RelE/ParE family toxin [Lactobacillus sp.]|nr:type II toxin-antitoxin system RelE/ParE family toxin [Lactobacillus sp.]
MEIFAKSNKLTKILNNPDLIQKNYGKLAEKINARLDEFSAAGTLRDIPSTPPPKCHALKGNRKGQFAVTLSGNYRLVFEGYDKNDQLSDDKDRITTVSILAIEDYHK